MRAEPRCGQNQTHSEQCNPVVAGRQLHHCQAVIRLRPIKDAYRATAGGERNVLHCRHHLFSVQCTSRSGVDTSGARSCCCEFRMSCMQVDRLWKRSTVHAMLSSLSVHAILPSVKDCVKFSLRQRVCAILPSVKDYVKFSLCQRVRAILPSVKDYVRFSLCQRVRAILPSSSFRECVFNSLFVRVDVILPSLQSFACSSSVKELCVQFCLLRLCTQNLSSVID